MTKALMVIDVQASLFLGKWAVPNHAELLSRIGDRVLQARMAGEPVIFVQNDGPEDELDAPGLPMWDLVIHPRPEEMVVRKTTQNVFESNPDLADELRARGITEIEACGVQSELCLVSSIRGAHEKGFRVSLHPDLHGTYDGGYPGADSGPSAKELHDGVQREVDALSK